jgi:hypothetical protein
MFSSYYGKSIINTEPVKPVEEKLEPVKPVEEKPEPVEPVEEKPEPVEDEKELNDEEFYDHFMKDVENENIKHGFRKILADDFVDNIKIWYGQREINKDHIDNLIIGIDNLIIGIDKQNYVSGTFKVYVSIKEKKIRLFDGQHRTMAIKKIRENYIFNPLLLVEIMYIPSINNIGNKNIMVGVNSTLVYKKQDEPDDIALDVINELEKLFKNCFVDKPLNVPCIRPKTRKVDLQNKLKRIIDKYKFENKKNISRDDIINSILNINNKYKNYSFEEINGLFNKKTDKISKKLYDKAFKFGWILGIFKNCSWFNELKL